MDLTIECRDASISATPIGTVLVELIRIDPADIESVSDDLLAIIGRNAAIKYFQIKEAENA